MHSTTNEQKRKQAKRLRREKAYKRQSNILKNNVRPADKEFVREIPWQKRSNNGQ